VSSTSEPYRRAAWPVLGTCVVVALFVGHARALDYSGDDGFITLRYVRNLLEGHGLVYNLGERVEGYTNFLWVIVVAALGWALHTVPLEVVARVAGIALGAATVATLARLSWRIAGPGGARVAPLLAPLLLAVSTPYAAWAGGMLECSLLSLALVGSAAAYADFVDGRCSLRPWAVFASAAVLTRPEGLLLSAVTLAWEALRRRRDGMAGLSWARPAGIVGLVAVAHESWRVGYYGALLPNTFHAKVSPGLEVALRGMDYLGLFALTGGAPLLVLPLALVLRRPADARLVNAALVVGVHLAYVVVIGGDGLAFDRFITFILPLLCLLAQEGLRTLLAGLAATSASAAVPLLPWRRRASIFAAVLVPAVLVVGSGWRSALALGRPAWPWFRDASSGLSFPGDGRVHAFRFYDPYFSARVRVAGAWLDREAAPDALVASNPAGIGYSCRQRVLDMLGLNDPVIARSRASTGGGGRAARAGHERGDGAYVLSRRPDYVLLGNVAVLPFPLDDEGVRARLYLTSERQIWDDPSFHQDYERVVVQLDERGPFQFFTFYRRRREEP
jgi:hypothetical protein